MLRNASSGNEERYISAASYRNWEEGLLRQAADEPALPPPSDRRRSASPPRRRSPSPDDLRVSRLPPPRGPRAPTEISTIALVLTDACRYGVEGYMRARREETDAHEARLRQRGFVVERRTISGTALTLEGVWGDARPPSPRAPRPPAPAVVAPRAPSAPRTEPVRRPIVKTEPDVDELKPARTDLVDTAAQPPRMLTFPARLGPSLAWNAALGSRVRAFLELCVPLRRL